MTTSGSAAPEIAAQFVTTLIGLAPVIIASLAGIVLALVTWKHHPRVSVLMLAGFALLLIIPGISTILRASFYPVLFRQFTARDLRVVMPPLNIVTSVFTATAYGLLIWAVPTGRRQPAPTSSQG